MRLFHLAWFSIPAAIVAICIGVVAYHWSAVRAEYIPWDSFDTRNPSYFYWPTAQALRELETVKTDLETIADGSTVDPDTLSFHIDVLISGINIIVRPSDLNDGYGQLPGFLSDAAVLAEFATDVLPSIRPNISSSEAQLLLPKFKHIYNTLSTVSKASWIQDSHLKEKSFETIRTGNSIILITAGLLIFAVLSFVVMALCYWAAIMAKTRALAAAEAAVEDKIDFLAMISHELRTPLQVIISALDVLERPQDVKTRNELTGRIRRAANSLAVQLRDMLTLARAQTGYIELQPGALEAIELVREVVENYRAAAEAKHLELRQICPDETIFVVADSERIAQLLHNLVSNAVKYTPTGYVQVDLAPFDAKAAELVLRVRDTGPGLPPRVLEKKVDAKGLYSLGSGRGIGLSVVQTLLQQLGARMTISSPPEGGAVFDVIIPVVPVSERLSETSDVEQKRILLVDDQPDLLKGLSTVLEELGFVTDIAPSGMTALNFLAAHPYSVIFIDLDMPIMSGSELAAQIRKTDTHRRIKVVAMSAAHHGSNHDLSSFDGVLSKPVRQQQLMTIMQF
ncbi:hybrid sensor histidine kinase/response regulator [Rhizobium beringeri]|uniref:hybrid sensor histidine kinase/response regulator n=1 Tax=Rhizobium beringeri TaxID=3019934 RepID=UPI003B5CC7FC